MSLDPVTTIVEDSKDLLIQQYVDKPKIRSLVGAIVGPLQGVEDVFQDLLNKRGVDLAEGIQLDRLGFIVGQKREGRSDDSYRIRIKIKIIQNISEGEPDTLIQVYGFLIGNELVMLQEHYPAGVGMMAKGEMPAGEETNIYRDMQSIAAAGCRVDYLGTFDALNPFTFAGGPTISGGFGDLNDLGIGGKFGQIHIPVDIKFVFEGSANTNQGFGDLRDPVMGGHF